MDYRFSHLARQVILRLASVRAVAFVKSKVDDELQNAMSLGMCAERLGTHSINRKFIK